MNNFTATDSLLPEYESFPRWLLTPFLIMSIVESLMGIVGNILVIIIILFHVKSNHSQTFHNCFIVNLALSDSVLCLFTMPLNTYRSLNVFMTFPPAFCKLADSFPAINICVSSLTIVAISIYRYLLVCCPHRKFLGTGSMFLVMISIWLLAIGASSPLFIYSQSIPVFDEYVLESMAKISCGQSSNDFCEESYVKLYRRFHICHESWPNRGQAHVFYTIFMFVLQFILPIFIICLTYYQVMIKLRERFRYRFLMKRNNIVSLRHEIRRQRRNNVLLLLIVALYAISWLPFNISYILFTYADRFRPAAKVHSFRDEKVNELSQYLPLRFLICMISAISNPFLYSYFNEAFREGLQKFFCHCCPRINRGLSHISFSQNESSLTERKLDQIYLNQAMLSRTSYYQTSNCKIDQASTLTRPSHDPSTRLTIISSQHIPLSPSS